MTSRFRKPWVFAALALIALAGVGWFAVGRRVAVVALQGSGMDPSIPSDLRVAPSIDPGLAGHSSLYTQRVEQVGRRVHVAIGYGLANIVWIEGTEGVIVVDTGENVEQAQRVLTLIRERTQLPIVAVILTHHHADHVGGTRVFLPETDAGATPLRIIAHASLVNEYADETGILAELQAARAMHMFGGALGPADRDQSNAGIGPFLTRGEGGFVAPTETFQDSLDVNIAGVAMSMRWIPSEADSEIAIYLRDDRILLSADIIQGHTFPNLYTIRGARFRDPLEWVRGIDVMRVWDTEAMVLHHGPPVVGKQDVARVLRIYRDQIQYAHDQTVRLMNLGMSPREIAEQLALPKELEAFAPWTTEFYGTLKHSVRNIHAGYVGWFAGDPVELDPTPRKEQAQHYVSLMGGRERVLNEARKAFQAGKHQAAAELATLLLQIKLDDEDARHLKAAAFRKLGYAQRNASWRNYYLVSAMELDEQIPAALYLQQVRKLLGPNFATLPPENQVRALPPRLRGPDAVAEDVVFGIRYLDVDATFRLHLRNGMIEVQAVQPNDTRFIVGVTQRHMGELLAGADPKEWLDSGVVVEGDTELAKRVFGLLEPSFARKAEVVVR